MQIINKKEDSKMRILIPHHPEKTAETPRFVALKQFENYGWMGLHIKEEKDKVIINYLSMAGETTIEIDKENTNIKIEK